MAAGTGLARRLRELGIEKELFAELLEVIELGLTQ
jgi:hypothetical protein